MGVRTYTLSMTALPSSTPPAPRSLGEVGPTPLAAQSGVVVDWSSVTDVNAFKQWVSTCPRPSGIRVYLPPVAYRASMYRLQRSLQSLGCTVTCRVISSVKQ